MKSRLAVIILLLIALGLGLGLLLQRNQEVEERNRDAASILKLSNDVVTTTMKLQESETVNLTLETNLTLRKIEVENLSNTLSQTAATLAKTQSDAKAAAEAAATELAKRDAKIAELQGQNDEMTKKMSELNVSIGSLEKQISETERKLAASEGDRVFLVRELKRLQTEKAELERQFNDLAVLREQVSRLKEELSISRRLDWIRRGIYGRQNQKGGEALLQAPGGRSNAASSEMNFELRQVRPGGTNAPPTK